MKNSSVKKSGCEFCGNNPVPHFIYWYFESLDVAFGPLRRSLLKLWRMFYWGRPLGWVKIGAALNIISFQEDIKKCKVRRAQVMWEEAERRGWQMRELLLFGRPFDVYGVRKAPQKKELFFSGLPRPCNYNRIALDVMDDKAELKIKLSQAGLPVPAGGSVWNFRAAKKIFNKIKKPVIVKPRAGSRGRHSTTFVYTLADLQRAYRAAKQLCFWVIVEEQLTGPVYRATTVNFELCGVLRGDGPQVSGNGQSGITELIKIKNEQKHPEVADIVASPEMEKFLARQNLSLNTILPLGQQINLSEKIGVSYGGSSSEDLAICHSDNKELFVKAARVVGDPLIGFDFIIPDITKSCKNQKCGFLEANSLPFINLHHEPLKGPPQNVAAKVWDMVSDYIC